MFLNSSGHHRAKRRFAKHLVNRWAGRFGEALHQTPLRIGLLASRGLLRRRLTISRHRRLGRDCLSFRALVLHEGFKLSICTASQLPPKS